MLNAIPLACFSLVLKLQLVKLLKYSHPGQCILFGRHSCHIRSKAEQEEVFVVHDKVKFHRQVVAVGLRVLRRVEKNVSLVVDRIAENEVFGIDQFTVR